MKRRSFVKGTMAGATAAAASTIPQVLSGCGPGTGKSRPASGRKRTGYNTGYEGEFLDRVAFPLGGIGAGMICLEGTGALSHVSLRNRPEIYNEPLVFAAVCVQGERNVARVLEGPVPSWKAFGNRGTGNGAAGQSYGLPRFERAAFNSRFPFGNVTLNDRLLPLEVRITGWSPFIPGDPDNSSLPAAALEYSFRNAGARKVEAVFSFHARNFMEVRRQPGQSVGLVEDGFVLRQDAVPDQPWLEGSFWAGLEDPGASVNCRWFRGGWWDPLTIAWKNVEEGAAPSAPPFEDGAPGPGASLYLPLSLEPRASRTLRLLLAWHVPQSDLRLGEDPPCCSEESGDMSCCDPSVPEMAYKPWYSARFDGIADVASYWRKNVADLREQSERFSRCFHDTTLPPEVVEAVAANLTILKSPTVLRQTDGRLWAWEGCGDDSGCCRGSCTHVWNYAQALPHLFPSLERSLRLTEFGPGQDDRGHQMFRASLPVRPMVHDFHAACDGQLGGIMKAFREWRISGDNDWLADIWPRVRLSLDYCIEAWDPRHRGVLEEPHHNTYDIEFWGPDGMCSSFYLGALRAATLMGEALGDDVSFYSALCAKGRRVLEDELFDGEYFIQKIQWEGLRAKDPVEASKDSWTSDYSDEAKELLLKEGPKYQYGSGCLSDGILGAWIAEVCGVGEILDRRKVASHLASVHRYNFRADLSAHANPQRPGYALGAEGGLLLCSWPKGGRLSLPFVYSDEVWTGIEYQVASHLMMMGLVEQGLEIVRACRDRYDGRARNPFNEYECGHWYARAMASYGLLQGLSGARYDAFEKTLYLRPSLKGDFRAFLSTAGGYGTVGVKNGEPFLEVAQGSIPVERTLYTPAV